LLLRKVECEMWKVTCSPPPTLQYILATTGADPDGAKPNIREHDASMDVSQARHHHAFSRNGEPCACAEQITAFFVLWTQMHQSGLLLGCFGFLLCTRSFSPRLVTMNLRAAWLGSVMLESMVVRMSDLVVVESSRAVHIFQPCEQFRSV